MNRNKKHTNQARCFITVHSPEVYFSGDKKIKKPTILLQICPCERIMLKNSSKISQENKQQNKQQNKAPFHIRH